MVLKSIFTWILFCDRFLIDFGANLGPTWRPKPLKLRPSWLQMGSSWGLCWPMLRYFETSWGILPTRCPERLQDAPTYAYVEIFWEILGHLANKRPSDLEILRSWRHHGETHKHTHQCFKTPRHKQQSSKCYTTLKSVTRFPFIC